MQGIDSGYLQHDSYKSDVYSLGLTLLYMASLKECTDLLKLDSLEIKTRNRIDEIQSEIIRNYLYRMLKFNKDERPKFAELHNDLIGSKEIILCTGCDKRISDTNILHINGHTFCNQCTEKANQQLTTSIMM